MRRRLARFVAAIDAEVAHIKNDSSDRSVEIVRGSQEASPAEGGAVYAFSLAESAFQLDADAGGTLEFDGRLVKASVVAHEGSRLSLLLVDDGGELPATIEHGVLSLSQTDLLERLADRLEVLSVERELGMAPAVFGEVPAAPGRRDLPPRVRERFIDEEGRLPLEQCIGSPVTFLWGPPGTGKTFSIAGIVAALVESGETVLVTSHTHAAVEQALWALVEAPSDGRPGGLLAGSEPVEQGRILKIGPLRDAKIPPECHLDSRLELDAERRRAELEAASAEAKRVEEQLGAVRETRRAWDGVDRAEREAHRAVSAVAAAERAEKAAASVLQAALAEVESARADMASVEASFIIGRKSRTERARSRLAVARERAAAAEAECAVTATNVARQRATSTARADEVLGAHAALAGLPDRAALDRQAVSLNQERKRLTVRITKLQEEQADLAETLVTRAQALFATLTKLFVDLHLQGKRWDTVVIDEASMAQPPLVAVAAALARKRVIVCGDFYQLPPVVRSRKGVAPEELGRDLFEIRGIPQLVEGGGTHPQMATLQVQRRMHPGIAAVARELVYRDRLKDHPSVLSRPVPHSVGTLGTSEPLVVVDIGPLHAWCNKARSSRFNLRSGQAALEIAALYASRTPKPAPGEPRPVGVITPYAPQKRYLIKLLEAMGDLGAWVTIGSVHTFQGNECDVIVFDSVVGAPDEGPNVRLTQTQGFKQVRRDLNVAVTRARHQFVFVGDVAWLDRHAKPASGLGRMWSYLRSNAPILDVRDVLGASFGALVAEGKLQEVGFGTGGVALLDETTFYPVFLEDLAKAGEQVVLFTPYIGKRRWPEVGPHVVALADRGVPVLLPHKPLTDRAWREGDPVWGQEVFDSLAAAGVQLVPVPDMHAKTIVVDRRIVFEGSLNWASQTNSYEHMLRIDSPEVAKLVEQLMEVRKLARPAARAATTTTTTGRAAFAEAPMCPLGRPMTLSRTRSDGWCWRCHHSACTPIPWQEGDIGHVPKSAR